MRSTGLPELGEIFQRLEIRIDHSDFDQARSDKISMLGQCWGSLNFTKLLSNWLSPFD
jgi:hypothetical protein